VYGLLIFIVIDIIRPLVWW